MKTAITVFTTGFGGVARYILTLSKSLSETKFQPVLLLRDKRLIEKANNLYLETRYLSKYRKYDFFFLYRVCKTLKSLKANIIHTNGTLSSFCVALCLSRIQGRIAHVITVHSLPEIDFSYGKTKLWFHYKLNLFAWKRAARIIVMTGILKKHLVKLRINEKKISVIYNGIDHKIFEGHYLERNQEQQSPEGCVVIGTAGRLSKEKGHDIFIQAIVEVLRRKKDMRIRAVILGDGQEKSKLKSLIKEMNLNNNIQLAGFKEDIGKALSLLDIFVLPSRMESFPMILLEAGAIGLPIVATNVGGIPEMIESNREGLLIAPESPHQMADAIIKLIDSPELRLRLGETFRNKVTKELNLESMVQHTLSIYNEAVALSNR